MSERPILFSAPMVRAIIAGTKTQTRRLFNPAWRINTGGVAWEVPGFPGHFRCPYGSEDNDPPDRLWVKETFAPRALGGYWYAADHVDDIPGDKPDRWRPSILMPRRAARIVLELRDVRLERLMEITEDDARAEGLEPIVDDAGQPTSRRLAFSILWDGLNEDRAPFASNPWVWAMTFRRVEP